MVYYHLLKVKNTLEFFVIQNWFHLHIYASKLLADDSLCITLALGELVTMCKHYC